MLLTSLPPMAGLWKRLFENKHQSWAFFGQATRMASAFVFVGALARTLTPELLAKWYVFGAMFGFASLAEMGLGQVFSRHIAYKKTELHQEKISISEFVTFIRQGERYYFYLAGVVFLLAASLGSWWIGFREPHGDDISLLSAWLLYAIGGAFSVVSIYYVAVLNGSGEVWKTYQIAILTSLANVVFLLFIFFFKNSLLVPVCAYLFSQYFGFVLLRRKVNSSPTMERMREISIRMLDIGAFKDVRNDAAKMLLGMASYQALTGGFLLVLSGYFSPAVVASYGLTMQFSAFVQSIAMIWVGTAFYDMAARHKSGDLDGTKRVFWAAFRRSSIVSLVGMIGILVAGPFALHLLGSRTQLFEAPILAVLVAVYWVEFTLSLFTQFLISQGDLRAVYFSLCGSVLICATATILSHHGYGLPTIYSARLLCFLLCMGFPFICMSVQLFNWRPELFSK